MVYASPDGAVGRRLGRRGGIAGVSAGPHPGGPLPRRVLLVVPAAFLVAVQPVGAQPPSVPTTPPSTEARVAAAPAVWTPAIGMRTRVTSPALGPGRSVARVLGYRADTLMLRPDGTQDSVAVPFAQVTRLDVSRGRKTNVRKGLLIGLLGGATLGAVSAYAAYEEDSCEANQFICIGDMFSRSEETLMGGAVVGLLGAAVGGVVGAIWRTERWERAPLGSSAGRVGLAPARGGGLALAVSF